MVGSYLPINHTPLLVHLIFIVVIDPVSREENLILVRRYRALICQRKRYLRLKIILLTLSSNSASVLFIPPCCTMVQKVVL